jgi:hypothetical protein
MLTGAHFAETSMFLNITGILATFNISKFVTKDGEEIEPEINYISHGATSFVEHLPLQVLPRTDRFFIRHSAIQNLSTVVSHRARLTC